MRLEFLSVKFEISASKKIIVNIKKLKQAEQKFLDTYPGGFFHPEMIEIAKKHRMDKLIDFAQNTFTKQAFQQPTLICDGMTKLISRSSLISVFEKPKFRDFVNSASDNIIQSLSIGLNEQLYGQQQKGLERLVDTLKPVKLAKWSLTTVIANYVKPTEEVFVKPTTAKGVIQYFELEDLIYKPLPSWAFYQTYRKAILEMKSKVDSSLTQSNAAFCGFLMMSLPNRH